MARRPGRPALREERIGPTPETAAKRRDDHLAALPASLQLAAMQIRQARKWLSGPLGVRISAMERVIRGRRELTDPQAVAVEQYLNWERESIRRGLAYHVVLRMVSEGDSPAEIERVYRLPTGRATELLLESLALWFGMWVDGRLPAMVSARPNYW